MLYRLPAVKQSLKASLWSCPGKKMGISNSFYTPELNYGHHKEQPSEEIQLCTAVTAWRMVKMTKKEWTLAFPVFKCT